MTLTHSSAVPTLRPGAARPRALGKFLFVGSEKLYVCGVTYGTFRPDADGHEFPPREVVELDFELMARRGVNAVRTYTPPPLWLLDAAARRGLRILVGLCAEREVGYLNDSSDLSGIEDRMRARVETCAGHPAVLAYTLGNEIPAPVVRWFGRQRIERYLAQLARIVRAADPGALVTYVNYPSTEYLELPFVDFVSFNVYLEDRDRFESYLARLQNLAGERPLVMAEIGLDSLRNGPEAQARSLDAQIRTAFASGCAGVFAYAWTDAWYRSGEDVHDWDFGLVTRDRIPKPALAAVERAFAEVPFPAHTRWPRISVVVCSYNGSRTLRDCLDGLTKLDYPDFEVLVIDDGSTDATLAVAQEYCFRVIHTENRGLSAARNTGMEAATGEIVAYTDDDARPDPQWLRYLAWTYLRTGHVGVGGPNIAPPGDGFAASCIANSPGGPVQVLLSDTVAEHIPGCNMSFRRDALIEVGGFDPRYRTAGDDVDLCWRLQERGGTLGFHAGAMVWHHRRNSVRTYWKQQQGYGRAEALLEAKWPEKYNALGHLAWAGRLYGQGLTAALALRRGRVYQGLWGSAPYQSVYEPATGLVAALPLMPEWYFMIAALGILSACAADWRPLLVAIPLLALALMAPIAQAIVSAARARFAEPAASPAAALGRRMLTAGLHLLQPLARLRGRVKLGLTPWRGRGLSGAGLPLPRTFELWSERWRSPDARREELVEYLRAEGAITRLPGEFERWDLEVRGGVLGSARVLIAVEEHGGGRQMVRARAWPRVAPAAVATTFVLLGLAALAFRDGARIATGTLAAMAAILAVRLVWEAGAALAAASRALRRGLGPRGGGR